LEALERFQSIAKSRYFGIGFGLELASAMRA
jgi:hypothetical protein